MGQDSCGRLLAGIAAVTVLEVWDWEPWGLLSVALAIPNIITLSVGPGIAGFWKLLLDLFPSISSNFSNSWTIP